MGPVTGSRMVGLSLLTYVSAHLSQNIGEIDCDRVKTGIEGLGGNKGGAAWWQVLGANGLQGGEQPLSQRKVAKYAKIIQDLGDAFLFWVGRYGTSSSKATVGQVHSKL